jgi:hypothetical protein
MLRQAVPSDQPNRERSPTIFFGTILVGVSIGAFIPGLFGREIVGHLETFTEAVPEPA